MEFRDSGVASTEKVFENVDRSSCLWISFEKWLASYCCKDIIPEGELKDISLNCENEKIYGILGDEKTYIRAILDYISGMTDRFAIKVFNELLTY